MDTVAVDGAACGGSGNFGGGGCIGGLDVGTSCLSSGGARGELRIDDGPDVHGHQGAHDEDEYPESSTLDTAQRALFTSVLMRRR